LTKDFVIVNENFRQPESIIESASLEPFERSTQSTAPG